MSTIVQLATIASATVAAAGGCGGLLWWTFKRGLAVGILIARVREQARAQAQAQAEIQALRQAVSELKNRKWWRP